MKQWNSPLPWKTGFQLYRRRRGTDQFGNPTAEYDMERPDAVRTQAEGMHLQVPRSWNSGGRLDRVGARLEDWGETAGGILEGFLFEELEIAVFDRLAVEGEVYEVRSVHRWPGHRLLMLQRIR